MLISVQGTEGYVLKSAIVMLKEARLFQDDLLPETIF